MGAAGSVGKTDIPREIRQQSAYSDPRQWGRAPCDPIPTATRADMVLDTVIPASDQRKRPVRNRVERDIPLEWIRTHAAPVPKASEPTQTAMNATRKRFKRRANDAKSWPKNGQLPKSPRLVHGKK